MVGRDPEQLSVRRVGTDATEERADLELPLLEVRAQERRLFCVGQLQRAERLSRPAHSQTGRAARAQVLDPLRLPARGDKVVVSLKAEQVDRSLAPLTRPA